MFDRTISIVGHSLEQVEKVGFRGRWCRVELEESEAVTMMWLRIYDS